MRWLIDLTVAAASARNMFSPWPIVTVAMITLDLRTDMQALFFYYNFKLYLPYCEDQSEMAMRESQSGMWLRGLAIEVMTLVSYLDKALHCFSFRRN